MKHLFNWPKHKLDLADANSGREDVISKHDNAESSYFDE
jgi:hypothetical protein